MLCMSIYQFKKLPFIILNHRAVLYNRAVRSRDYLGTGTQASHFNSNDDCPHGQAHSRNPVSKMRFFSAVQIIVLLYIKSTTLAFIGRQSLGRRATALPSDRQNWRVLEVPDIRSWCPQRDQSSPSPFTSATGTQIAYFSESDIVEKEIVFDARASLSSTPSLAFARAGPRDSLYFNPSEVTAAIVT